MYNREDCIARCIDSVIRNLHDEIIPVEHIIVDDGSSDRTAQIVEAYSREYSHIKFIKLEKNKGVNAARNAAISRASREFCIILDSDDFFVDDAIETINAIVKNNTQFKHFLFTADDIQPTYAQNYLLNGRDSRVLSFADFLAGKLLVGFIHCMTTNTLRCYPFDENLRTYEGVFFMRFYKKAGRMLFTNQIVTIRERNRMDSVSLDFLRTSDKVIKRTYEQSAYYIKWFQQDFKALGLISQLERQYKIMLDNALLLSDYSKAKYCMDELSLLPAKVSTIHRFIYSMKLGYIYKMTLRLYLFIKYRILKKQFN